MTQPAPGYQPYQPLPPMPVPPRPSRGMTSVIAGVLALVAAGLAVGGSFGTISSYRNAFPSSDSVYAEQVTWWQVTHEEGTLNAPDNGFISGLVIALAAALLIGGAIALFARPRGVAGRSLTLAGAGVLTGAVLLQLLMVIDTMGVYNSRELSAGESLEYDAGLGLYLPLGAVVVGIVAAVLTHLGGPKAIRVEPNTPRMGFPAPYGYQQAPGMSQQGAPVPPGAVAPVQGQPLAERATDVNVAGPPAADDDSDTTQVVSNATATGTAPEPAAAPPAPPLGAPPVDGPAPTLSEPPAEAPVPPLNAPPSEPSSSLTAPPTETPAQLSEPPVEAPAPTLSEPPTEVPTPPLNTPPTETPAPSLSEPPAEAPAAPPAPTTAEAPSTPPGEGTSAPGEATGSPAEPATSGQTTETPAAPATPAQMTDKPAESATPGETTENPAGPAPITDLPAAPPPPELSSGDDRQ